MPELRKRNVPSSSSSISKDDRQAETDSGDKYSIPRIIGSFIILLCLIFGTILYFLPSPIDPISYSVPSPPEFTGPLAENDLLTKTEKLFVGKVRGPESITIHNGKLYTGTADGKILEIHGNEIRVVASLGTPPCGRFEDEPTCGRPLGMRFDKDGSLVVVDTYLGLFRVNVETGKFVQLYTMDAVDDEEPASFLNDMDIGEDGTIYVTDSSSKWDRRHNRYCALEARENGRVLVYHPGSKKAEVLMRNLCFPNGVQLSPGKDFLLVVELCKFRILKYYLTGPRKGEVDVFSDNLPGAPDNIRPSSRGGYWVGLATMRKAGRFSFIDFTTERPWLKKLIFKVFGQEMLLKLLPRYGLAVELDSNGNIVRSLHDPSGQTMPGVSEVEDDNGILYLGSYFLPYIGRLNLQE